MHHDDMVGISHSHDLRTLSRRHSAHHDLVDGLAFYYAGNVEARFSAASVSIYCSLESPRAVLGASACPPLGRASQRAHLGNHNRDRAWWRRPQSTTDRPLSTTCDLLDVTSG